MACYHAPINDHLEATVQRQTGGVGEQLAQGLMRDRLKTGFSDRLQAAAAAKRAQLEKFTPKPAQIDPDHARRAELRAAELLAVREQREAAKAAKKQAIAEAAAAAERARVEAEEAALLAKRGERKERKALSAAEAKAKRDAKYAARRARA